jgi:hypothetical protein
MPSASETMRKSIIERFGSLNPDGPIKYLLDHGWRLTRNFFWIPPSRDYTEPELEGECIDFLIDEWDYGGVL